MVHPESKQDVYRLLELLPPTTAILETGNGLLIMWGLERPFAIASDADRDEAAKLSREFQAGVRRVAKARFGWDFDTTSDLARLIRIGGTLNHKSTPPKPVFFWGDRS